MPADPRLYQALSGGQAPQIPQQPAPVPPGSPGIGAGSMYSALSSPDQMSPDDFTQPGEMIPKDAGIMDFLKYNVAHFDPRSEENLMGMAGSVGNVNKVGSAAARAAQAGKAVQDLGQGVSRTAQSADQAMAGYNQRALQAKMGPPKPTQVTGPVDRALLTQVQQPYGLYKGLK